MSFLTSHNNRASNSSSNSSTSNNNDGYYSQFSFSGIAVVSIIYSLISNVFLKITGTIIERDLPLLLDSESNSKLLSDTIINNNNDNELLLAIVTGSNTGIGYETARTLVIQYGYTVILACRSRDKAIHAMEQINQDAKSNESTTKGKAIFITTLDLSSIESVKAFCIVMNETYSNTNTKLHLLINNAGINAVGEISIDNYDLTFQSNFLGHYILTCELIKMNLFIPKHSRIINLSSVMHHFCSITGKNMEQQQQTLCSIDFWKSIAKPSIEPSITTYSFSKLAAILFTMELNYRYNKSHGIQSIAVNPGAVNSDIWRTLPRFIIPIFKLIYLNNQQGCRTSVIASVLKTIPIDNNNDCSYIQPYWLPGIMNDDIIHTVPSPIYEMLGPYQGYRFTKPRLPARCDHDTNSNQLSAQVALWKACEELTGCIWPDNNVVSETTIQ